MNLYQTPDRFFTKQQDEIRTYFCCRPCLDNYKRFCCYSSLWSMYQISLIFFGLQDSIILFPGGGQNWTGETVCVSGATCTYSNPWYVQLLIVELTAHLCNGLVEKVFAMSSGWCNHGDYHNESYYQHHNEDYYFHHWHRDRLPFVNTSCRVRKG